MQFSSNSLLRGFGWITAAFLLANVARFGSNVYLTKILTPELMGAVLVIMTLRNAIELLSDVGVGQNIVTSKDGNDPRFLSTAWLMQVARGGILSLILFLMAGTVARTYGVPEGAVALASLSLLATGMSSVMLYVVQRNLRYARLSNFELAHELIGIAFVVIGASLSQTIWAVVAANLASATLRAATTYFLAPRSSWTGFSTRYAMDIIRFGKWIMLTSALALVCANFDRLYLGQVVPLALLGIFGIARALCDIPIVFVNRLNHMLIFPVIAASAAKPREELRADLGTIRWRMLVAGALIMAVGITLSDIAVRSIYDSRYHEAAIILPILLTGLWFAVLASINDLILLGLSRPVYGVIANASKATYLVIGVPLAMALGGFYAAVAALAAADLLRIIPIMVGMRRERLSFFRQDLAATLIFVASALVLSLLRYALGFGTIFHGIVR